MIYNLFDMLFGCTHSNYSFPITAKGAHRNIPAASVTGTYVVCLDCGKEFAYDWEAMKVVNSDPQPVPQVDPVEALLKRAA
ncbi:MAG TPA: hypothetical protein VF135_14115 [Terriglobales bacterium]